jgi:periplasmic protein TonB
MDRGFQSRGKTLAIVAALAGWMTAGQALAEKPASITQTPPTVSGPANPQDRPLEPGNTTAAPPAYYTGPAPMPPRSIRQPSWSRTPQTSFPRAARDNGILQGRVRLRCITSRTGTITQCAILSETPPGYDFGSSAVDAALRARVIPRTLNGEAVDGSIEFAVAFQAPAPEPSQPPAQTQR